MAILKTDRISYKYDYRIYLALTLIVFGVVIDSLLVCIQTLFKLREGNYHRRGLFLFEPIENIDCFSSKLWNGLHDELKLCRWGSGKP